MADAAIRAFCAQQREWLDLELKSEQDQVQVGNSSSSKQEEARRSHVLHQLTPAQVSVGLYGRTVVRLVSVVATDGSSAETLLPAHKFTTGDEVEIRSKSGGKNHPAGVISEVTESSLSVALFPSKREKSSENDSDEDDFGNPPFSLISRSNVEVHRKLLAALTELESKGVDHPVSGRIVQALFHPTPSANDPVLSSNQTTLRPFNTNLDASQLEAISFSLTSNHPIALIHGPPGTGKTTTVVELIQQAVRVHGWKVLVTAPSNVAVDNVLARLVGASSNNSSRGTINKRNSSKADIGLLRLRVVRLGHPARLQQEIVPYSLEALVHAADGTGIVSDVRAELQSHLRTLNGGPGIKGRSDRKRLAHSEVKALRREVRAREEKVVAELLGDAQVVLATCVGSGNQKLLSALNFDLVVIDEAAQALEAACWIPALQGSRLVLAGDHLQLPPTIMSNISIVKEGLGKTMFERVVELYGEESGKAGRVSRMLKVQYRMHESIANWASQALYGGELQTHESVKDRTLSQLEGIVSTGVGQEAAGLEETPLLLLDTAGCNMYESEDSAGSRFNEGEAQLVVQHVRKLIGMGVQQDQIAVITPYNGQVEVLRLALLPEAPKLQIRSVDGFQGGEREAVVLSLVRSSDRGGMQGIGFLRDERRLNVAVTRAKRHCCVICDTETVSQSPFVKNLIDWIEEHGDQRSALELMSDADVGQMDADLVQAELELQRITEKAVKPKSSAAKTSNRQALDPVDTERRRQALLEKIRAFQSDAKPGDEMVMSTELSKLDRKLVHEIAEDLCLGHQSEGVEGVNRRIKLVVPILVTILDAATSSNASARTEEGESIEPAAVANIDATPAEIVDATPGEVGVDDDMKQTEEPSQPTTCRFVALQVDMDDDDDDEDDAPPADGKGFAEQPALNSVLGSLAKERAERERQKQQQNVTQKPKTKKGLKLRGSKKSAPLPPPKDDGLEELDELAFLDAQIIKVQTSHGRKVEGPGKGYRTIINGVLLSKPEPTEKKKDAKATAALNAKLKEAQDGRKAKPKKK